MVTQNQNRDVSISGPARLLVEEVWSRGDLALEDELVAGEYVQIRPTPVGTHPRLRGTRADGPLREGIEVWNGIGPLRQLGALPEPTAN